MRQLNLQQKLEDIRTASILKRGKVRWGNIFRLIKRHSCEFHEEHVEMCCKFLLDTLLADKCNDVNIANMVIDTYLLWSKMDFNENEEKIGENIMKIISPLFHDYKAKEKYEIQAFVSLRKVLSSADYKLLVALITYRPCNTHMYRYIDIEAVIKLLQNFRMDVQEFVFHRPLDSKFALAWALSSITRLMRKQREMVAMWWRVFLKLNILNAVVLEIKMDPLVPNYVKSLKLYFGQIEDSFVSEHEIRRFVLYLLKNAVIADMMAGVYARLFPVEAALPYGPRSLAHLCRCVVRNIMVECKCPLPRLVKKLAVPPTVQHLLLGASELRA